jgi:hypothetical protein
MPPTVLSRQIRRQMDHCILALSASGRAPDAGETPSAYLSLYWISMTTECGPEPLAGHLAYLWVAGEAGAVPTVRVLTDAPALAAGLAPRTSLVRWELPGAWPEPAMATFVRTAASPVAHTWRVTAADGGTLEATWSDLGEPVFATGPTRDGQSAITTVLVSAGRGVLTVDGRPVPGVPFPDPIWTPWFGSEQTSCVMGLGETIHEPIG